MGERALFIDTKAPIMTSSGIQFRAAKLAVSALFLLALASIPFSDAAADDGSWRVVSATNAEVLVPGGTWQALAAEQTLAPNSEVRVGAGGRAELRSGGDSVTLSPNSHMAVPSKTPSGPSILQKLGTLLFRIEKRSPTQYQNVSTGQPKISIFNVETPYLAAVIKGTVFSVNVSQQGAALHVTEGLVETISLATGERGLVAPGQTARVSSLPGVGMTISTGGQVQPGNRATQAAAPGNDNANANANGGNSANAPGRSAGGGNGVGRGLSVPVASGIDVAKSTKGLLTMASANASANIGRGLTTRNSVPGNSAGRGKAIGQIEIPGVVTLPPGLQKAVALTGNNGNNGNNGNSSNNGNGNPGGGSPNNNPGSNNGNNGCNGNGNKPGC